ncbi:MAG: hypothetical protein AB7F09_20075 [Parvibaculaceae bacterium]
MAKKPKTTKVAVILPPNLSAALDRYIREEEPKMSPPETLRRAFRILLVPPRSIQPRSFASGHVVRP